MIDKEGGQSCSFQEGSSKEWGLSVEVQYRLRKGDLLPKFMSGSIDIY